MFMSKEEEANKITKIIMFLSELNDLYMQQGYVAVEGENFKDLKEIVELFKNMNYFDVREMGKKLSYHLSLYSYDEEEDCYVCKNPNLKRSLDEIAETKITRMW